MIRPVADSEIPQDSRMVLAENEATLACGLNFIRTVARAPAAFESLCGLVRAARRTSLPERTRQAIALRVAQLNGCEYCVAIHSKRARELGLDDATALDYRRGISDDPKEQALLSLTTKIVADRGHHAGFALEIARNAGTTDAELVEVIQLVALNIFSNYLSNLAETDLDVPFVELTLPAGGATRKEAGSE